MVGTCNIKLKVVQYIAMNRIKDRVVDGSANRSYGNLPKKLLRLGLVGFAMALSGCGIVGSEDKTVIKPSPAKIEKNVKKILNPSMARVGRDAVKFAQTDDNYNSFWGKSDGSKELSITGSSLGSLLEVTFAPGFDPRKSDRRIRSGDVEKVLVSVNRDIKNPLVEGDQTSARIEVDLSGQDENVCRRSYSAESDYHFDSENNRRAFSSYISLNECESSYVGTRAEDIPQEDAAYAVALDMTQTFDQELDYIEKAN